MGFDDEQSGARGQFLQPCLAISGKVVCCVVVPVFLSPLHSLQWRDSSCFDNQSNCHDEVDFSLCFEDTVILYSILFFLWIVAALTFLAGRETHRASLPLGFLHVTKLVSAWVVASLACQTFLLHG